MSFGLGGAWVDDFFLVGGYRPSPAHCRARAAPEIAPRGEFSRRPRRRRRMPGWRGLAQSVTLPPSGVFFRRVRPGSAWCSIHPARPSNVDDPALPAKRRRLQSQVLHRFRIWASFSHGYEPLILNRLSRRVNAAAKCRSQSRGHAPLQLPGGRCPIFFSPSAIAFSLATRPPGGSLVSPPTRKERRGDGNGRIRSKPICQ